MFIIDCVFYFFFSSRRRHTRCALVTGVQTCALPICFGGLAPMVAVWQGKCRNDALPRWKDFAIEDFVGWHRYVALSDLEPDGDPRFRIFGSGVAEILGGELTGKRDRKRTRLHSSH